MDSKLIIVGAGLAGSEACWQLIKRGIPVRLYEMRPKVQTKAHKTNQFAELVCSNSFRGAALSNAVGLLKEELKLCDSLIMQAALEAQVPAGGALAVDREIFSNIITNTLKEHSLVEFIEEEIVSIPATNPKQIVIIATGPLSSPQLSSAIEKLTGSDNLAFFDAISPIVFKDSIDQDFIFRQSRYDKGGDDYLNVPLDQEQYTQFINAVAAAEKYTGNIAVENDSLDKLRPFEGCMPIEDIVERGPDTLRHGAFKPKGLTDPRTNKQPYAVMQLRQDDKAGELWSMVGMQTRMKRHEQEKILRSLPGLAKAEFVRYGSVHRNTFIESPKCLDPTLEFRERPGLFFAGQITGVEGYVESTAGGLVAGINAARSINGEKLLKFPAETAIGSLMKYITDPERKNFQPMNISFGLISHYLNMPKKNKSKRTCREESANFALEKIQEFLSTNGL